MNAMIKRIDKNTDTATLKDSLAYFKDRAAVTHDSHLLEYYKLMVEYIKDILTEREADAAMVTLAQLAGRLVCSVLAIAVIWIVLGFTVQVGVLLWRVNQEDVVGKDKDE